jgi:hypothetical protein
MRCAGRHWQFGASSILRQQKAEMNGLVAIVEPIQSITAQLDLVVKPDSGQAYPGSRDIQHNGFPEASVALPNYCVHS